MTYNQKKNKNNISIEIGTEGIIYQIKDDTVNRSENVPFERILNDKYEFYESNKTFKNNAIYGAVVGAIFLAINIIYGTKLWAWLFILSAPTFYYLYYRSKAAFTVIKTAGDINLFVLQDKKHDEIIENIYRSRNNYLKENYMTINYDNAPQAELNKFSWLKELGVVNEKEYQVIKEEIENNME